MPPRPGLSWPLPGGLIEAMAEDDLNLLWPDRRSGSRKRRRLPVVDGAQAAREVRQRVDATVDELQVGLEGQGAQEVQEDAGDVEYVLNGDEDPWHEFD